MLRQAESTAAMEIPPHLTGKDLRDFINARRDSAADAAWLRPALFPEDDDG